jgi:integrase/recombinase XerD
MEDSMSEPLATLFEQFLKERIYLKAVTPKTKLWYLTAWKAFEASQAADGEEISGNLTKARLQAFVVHVRDRGLKARSVNTYLQALNAFARWLHEEQGHSPAHLSLLKTEKRILTTLTPQHMQQLIGYHPQSLPAHRLHVLVLTILDAGIRIDEALNLEWANVDFENLLLTVYGKGRKERRIPFSFELRKKLFRYEQLVHKRGMKFDLVFSTRNGTAMTQRNSLRDLYLLQNRLGLPKFGWHRLRHTFATEYLRAGGDVFRLSKILGHTQRRRSTFTC